ncbi:MAG: tetratricopeptide repeat protein, partial [Verrucomicrobiae bacterium]|nr:tetratricopeptide repeat protein [Verrucomicrobiae bacterium]
YFKAVIAVDPLISEAYYNLAVLCLRDNRIEDARRSYQKALELGALPDPDLEEKLANP